LIFIVTILCYSALLFMVFAGFLLYPNDPKKETELQKVTVIIAARNEEGRISHSIASVVSQDVPKHLIEIIVVDDASTDNTFKEAADVLSRSGVDHQVIQNSKHLGKKKSLLLAIEHSSSGIIICRDADTFTMSDKWLSTILNYMLSSKKEFVICPVAIAHNKGFLSALQETEMSILTLFTIASAYFHSPFLCNGANLAFSKKLFYRAGAYADHLHISSGDDIFFLEEVKKIGKQSIGYLKNEDAIVYTFPEKDLGSLFRQKIRWSSKTFKNTSVINWLSALIIGLSNFVWIGALLYMFLEVQNLPLGLFFILSKLLIDILLVFLASSFIKVKTGLLKVALVAFIYPFYASIVAVLSMFIKPKWKSN
jgi:poly-beta-1,6-N-acetyl-D-glucosamine synthase